MVAVPQYEGKNGKMHPLPPLGSTEHIRHKHWFPNEPTNCCFCTLCVSLLSLNQKGPHVRPHQKTWLDLMDKSTAHNNRKSECKSIRRFCICAAYGETIGWWGRKFTATYFLWPTTEIILALGGFQRKPVGICFFNEQRNDEFLETTLQVVLSAKCGETHSRQQITSSKNNILFTEHFIWLHFSLVLDKKKPGWTSLTWTLLEFYVEKRYLFT